MPTTERLLEFDGGRFTNLELVAEGRQAQVYRADEPFLRRTVALKIVRSPTVDAEVVELAERLHIEGVASTAVEHPNLVRVHTGSFTEDGDVSLVMEWLDGKNVADTIRDTGPFSVARALDVAIDVAQALDALHSRGIVHADVKPENIILTVAGTTKLIDLGQAHVRDLPGTAEPRDVLGSPIYVCPRYASTGLPDPRSDIFSLAATFCSMVVGLSDDTPAAEGCLVDSATTLRARGLPSIGALREKVAPSLATAVERALAPDPDQRFSTVRQFIEVLCEQRRALQSEAVDHHRTSSPPEAVEPAAVPIADDDADAATSAQVLESTSLAIENCESEDQASESARAATAEVMCPVSSGLIAAARLFDALLDPSLLDAVPASLEDGQQADTGARVVEPSEAIQKALASDADTPAVVESIRRLLDAETPVATMAAANRDTPDLGGALTTETKACSTLPWGTIAHASVEFDSPGRELPLNAPITLALGTPCMRSEPSVVATQECLAVGQAPCLESVTEPASGTFCTPPEAVKAVTSPQEVRSRNAQISGTIIKFRRGHASLDGAIRPDVPIRCWSEVGSVPIAIPAPRLPKGPASRDLMKQALTACALVAVTTGILVGISETRRIIFPGVMAAHQPAGTETPVLVPSTTRLDMPAVDAPPPPASEPSSPLPVVASVNPSSDPAPRQPPPILRHPRRPSQPQRTVQPSRGEVRPAAPQQCSSGAGCMPAISSRYDHDDPLQSTDGSGIVNPWRP